MASTIGEHKASKQVGHSCGAQRAQLEEQAVEQWNNSGSNNLATIGNNNNN
jgi:hypothetical protein